MIEELDVSKENIMNMFEKTLYELDNTPEEKLKLIELNEYIDFVDALFILQDFLQKNEILYYQITSLLVDYSEKITKINTCKEYNNDTILILLYSSVLLYNDLSNPVIKKKLKLKNFIKMMIGCNNNKDFPIDFLTHIYNKIYDRIKSYNIKDNILHSNDELNKKKCYIL
jgi:hypothetical protein